MFSEHSCPLHDPNHKFDILLLGKGCFLVELISKIFVIEGPLNKEEIVHDECIDLCKLINAAVEGIVGDLIVVSDVVD
jgi:hypothetical protein